jgi:hypothetical protein
MGHRIFLAALLAAVSVGLLAAPAPVAAKGNPKYAKDFEEFRKHVDKTYPFFDLKKIRKDWKAAKKTLEKRALACRSDGEFVQLLWDAVKVLRDAHMGIYPKEGIEVDWPKRWYPGLGLMPAAGGKVVVMHAPPGRENAMPTGTVVTKIDGKPARRFLDDQAKAKWAEGGGFSSPQRARLFIYRTPLIGEKGEKHEIVYLDGKKQKKLKLRNEHEVSGWAHTYNLPKDLARVGRSFHYSKLPSGVGYMYWRRIDESIEQGIPQALKAHPDAVDLRGNAGGGYGSGLIAQIKAIPGPVAAIFDAGCISAGETMIRDLVGLHKARTFGTTSAGSSSSKATWELPSGIATIRYSKRSRSGVGGKIIEFNGIEPDEVVEPVPEEVLAGKNTGILRAEEHLLKQKKR